MMNLKIEKDREKSSKKKKDPTTSNVWFSLKKSLHCKSEPSDVHDPKAKNHHHHHLTTILTKKSGGGGGGGGRSGCSRSIANLKDVIHGNSKRHIEKPPSTCSPRSIGSSEFLNPITHEVILSNSKCELKITGFGGGGGCGGGGGGENDGLIGGGGGSVGSNYVGTLRPGTPGPGGQYPTNANTLGSMHYLNNPSFRGSSNSNSNSNLNSSPPLPTKKSHFSFSESRERVDFGVVNHASKRLSLDIDNHRNSNGSSVTNVTCHKCGEQFTKWQVAEAHHLSKHAVTELVEGDSSRKIVEIICRTSWLKSENHYGRIERVLKVHNMQKTLAKFEEYREIVKAKASKLPKKHPRCIADGNELLRFYGTTLACSLGFNGSSSLCISEKCCVCRIIRTGFCAKKELKGGIGVFTTSTSGRAYESIEMHDESDGASLIRKALIVCRVIAGRVHRPLENIQEITGQSGFDSLAGKVGLYSSIEELYLLNPKALLPCFVVICKP